MSLVFGVLAIVIGIPILIVEGLEYVIKQHFKNKK